LKKLQPYLLLFRGFLPEAGVFCLRVGRQVVAPGIGRKGNLLSSLFLLFIGLTERVIGLARELVLRAPQGLCWNFPGKEWVGRAWVFSRRHLRWGMLVAAWVLFILSSWEWSVVGCPAGTETVVAGMTPRLAESGAGTTFTAERSEIGVIGGLHEVAGHGVKPTPAESALDEPAIGGRRWLRLCVLRI